jgi:hypothetical protein
MISCNVAPNDVVAHIGGDVDGPRSRRSFAVRSWRCDLLCFGDFADPGLDRRRRLPCALGVQHGLDLGVGIRQAARAALVPSAPENLGELGDTTDAPVESGGEIDRPFVDETGRIPDATLAPFAVGLGLALAATGLVFGLAPVIVGVLPLAWGAWRWLTAARDELTATDQDERTG